MKVSYRINISLKVFLCGDDNNDEGCNVNSSSGGRNTSGGCDDSDNGSGGDGEGEGEGEGDDGGD